MTSHQVSANASNRHTHTQTETHPLAALAVTWWLRVSWYCTGGKVTSPAAHHNSPRPSHISRSQPAPAKFYHTAAFHYVNNFKGQDLPTSNHVRGYPPLLPPPRPLVYSVCLVVISRQPGACLYKNKSRWPLIIEKRESCSNVKVRSK